MSNWPHRLALRHFKRHMVMLKTLNLTTKVILNYILVLDLDCLLIISLKTAYLSRPKGKIKIKSTDCFLNGGSLGI